MWLACQRLVLLVLLRTAEQQHADRRLEGQRERERQRHDHADVLADLVGLLHARAGGKEPA